MKNWKVTTRLAILAGVLSILLLGTGGLGLWGMQRAEAGMDGIYQDHMEPALVLGRIGDLLMRARLSLAIAVNTRSAETIKANADAVEANIAAIDKEWRGYLARVSNPEEERLARSFSDAQATFIRDGLMSTLTALRANEAERARSLLLDTARSLFVPVRDSNLALQTYHVEEAGRSFAKAQARNAILRITFISAVIGGVLFAIFFGAWLARSLGRQLGAEPSEAAEVAERVATGDLSRVIQLRKGDESSLMSQLVGMQQSLAGVVSGVRHSAQAVATATAQIAQGNLDLSQRTEQQASALEQTSASMEQLASAAQQNSENAQHANDLATMATDLATRGGSAVGQVVQTMTELSDGSQHIASIVGVIEGFASQTNILALNAAVEAARAGESGRGFAVVADEVRSLAQRSGQAAKEIKEIVADSMDRVGHGLAQVEQAGVTMRDVVDATQRVSKIVAEISVASAEQRTGVVQISKAVSQMDEVTQQNAALVEQSAAAADHLRAQAQEMVRSVAVFTV